MQVAGQAPQLRVLLASVPYALKAGDAATLGGLPASAFALAGAKTGGVAGVAAGPSAATPDVNSTVTTTGGTLGYLPKFSGTSTIVNSEIFDAGTGVGIGDTPNPQAKLDVNGSTILRGGVQLSRRASATPAAGASSYGLGFYTQAYDSATKAAVNPNFSWRGEPTGNNTASPGATMNLLYSNGNTALQESGLYFNGDGTIHFSPGQLFPSVPVLTGANTFNGNQTVDGNLTATSSATGALGPVLTLTNTGGNAIKSGYGSFH